MKCSKVYSIAADTDTDTDDVLTLLTVYILTFNVLLWRALRRR